MYNIARNNVVNLIYPDARMEKIVYQDNSMLLAQDTEGNTYRVTSTGISKYDNVQLSKILYQDDNIMIASDTNGYIYKISTAAFKKLEGFDEGTEIESVWADRITSTLSVSGYTYTSEADIIYFQDSNNGLWVTMQSTDGESAINSIYIKMSGIDGITAEELINVQKISAYTGGKIKKMYIDSYDYKREVACIDEDNNLWMWTAYRYEFMDGTPKIILENVVEYESVPRSYGGGHLVLDEEGNLYSFGCSDQSFDDYHEGGSFIIGSSDSSDEYKLVNLSTDHGIGKIKLFYLGDNEGAIAVNENNQIYGLLWGTEPLEFSLSYDDVEEIFGYAYYNYEDHFFFKKKNDDKTYIFYIRAYYRRAGVSYFSGAVPDYVERNIEQLIDKDSSGRINTPTDFDATSVTSEISTTYTGTTGLVVQDDNKLYFVDTTSSTCITDKAGQVDVFGKQFKVIRDSKYND